MSTPVLQNCIDTLRVVGQAGDSLAFRLKLQSLLSSTDFSLPGISPSAIVFIRSMDDPRPGTLRLVRNDLEGAHLWTDALQESLANKIREAERPASGTVPGKAGCVLFADKAEMLACLAGDWRSGSLRTRWWWKTLFRSGDESEIVKQVWREHPQYVPVALDLLERQSKAAPFIGALTDAECHQLLQNVLSSFAIQELAQVCEIDLPCGPAQATAASATAKALGRFEDNDDPHAERPWSVQSETSHADLSLEQERLLGIALIIQRAPVYARSSDFAQAVHRWQQVVSAFARDIGPAPLAPASPVATPHPERNNLWHTTVVASSERESQQAHKRRRLSNVVLSQVTCESEPALEVGHENCLLTVAGEGIPSEDSIEAELGPIIAGHDTRSDADGVETPRHTAPSTQLERITPIGSRNDHFETVSTHIATELGGLFYLINLALYLNLYGDFTMPAKPGLDLVIWDFVELVGRELVDDAHADDSIWSLLANLAGRSKGSPPDMNFEPADEWRLPPDWLAPFSSDQPWQWNASRGRLRVLHPAGFAVLDLRSKNNPSEQLQHELEPYDIPFSSLMRARSPKVMRLKSRIARRRHLRRWLSLLMPYVRARLRVALDLESQDDVATTLCCRNARVHASDTHVDIYFGLADLPLQVRFAGLDRDPGWVPAAGRFIAFHFD